MYDAISKTCSRCLSTPQCISIIALSSSNDFFLRVGNTSWQEILNEFSLPEQSFAVRHFEHFKVKQNLQHIPTSLLWSLQSNLVYKSGFSQYFCIEITLCCSSDSKNSLCHYKMKKCQEKGTKKWSKVHVHHYLSFLEFGLLRVELHPPLGVAAILTLWKH